MVLVVHSDPVESLLETSVLLLWNRLRARCHDGGWWW
jgi:hypothetical protein